MVVVTVDVVAALEAEKVIIVEVFMVDQLEQKVVNSYLLSL